MIWSRLKNFKCPNCNKVLIKNDFTKEYVCQGCNFYLSEEAFNGVINNLYQAKPFVLPRSIDDFNSGKFDKRDDHDEFWLNPKASE